MKEGCEIKNIGSICDIKTGKLDANAASDNGAYPFFTCSKETFNIDEYAYDCESVLIAGNGDLNVKYYNGKFNAYQRTYIITLKTSVININLKYIYKFFEKHIERLRQVSIGGVIKYIKLGDLTNAKILVPPLEEQEKIVAELDCLSGIIEKKKQQLKEYDALAQSIFYEMFGDPVENDKGWDISYLKEIAEFKNGLNFKKVENGRKQLFLGVSNFKDNSIINQIEEYSSINIADDITEEFLLKDNDIVFVRSNGSKELVGRNIIVYTGNEKITYSGFCIRCRIISSVIIPIFLNYMLSVPSIKQVIKNFGRGANISNLNQTMLGQIKVIVPPLTLQQYYISKIEAIEKQKALIKKSIEELETLFNSRMDYYFN